MNEETTIAEARLYLKRFGYLSNDFETAVPDESEKATESALREFQKFNGLEETGELSDTTLQLMATPRCGVPDVGEYVLSGRKWNTGSLSYFVSNTPPNINLSNVQTTVSDALKLWSDVSSLVFREASSASSADIVISFASGDHGDGYPFDGAGAVLPHAFFPPPGGPITGDCHFDNTETWAINLPITWPSIDLVSVAAHEFGHSLGLGHSSVSDALMYPYYSGPHRYLSADDTTGIQQLYPQPAQIFNGRLGMLKPSGQLYTKEGDLTAHWVYQEDGIRKFQLHGMRIGILRNDGTLYVKEGSQAAHWVRQEDNISDFQLEGYRIGILRNDGQLFVKEGSLSAPWSLHLNDVKSFKLASDLVAVEIVQSGDLLIKKGDLSSTRWIREDNNIADYQLMLV